MFDNWWEGQVQKEKKLSELTHVVTIFAEHVVQLKEKLKNN